MHAILNCTEKNKGVVPGIEAAQLCGHTINACTSLKFHVYRAGSGSVHHGNDDHDKDGRVTQ